MGRGAGQTLTGGQRVVQGGETSAGVQEGRRLHGKASEEGATPGTAGKLKIISKSRGNRDETILTFFIMVFVTKISQLSILSLLFKCVLCCRHVVWLSNCLWLLIRFSGGLARGGCVSAGDKHPQLKQS